MGSAQSLVSSSAAAARGKENASPRASVAVLVANLECARAAEGDHPGAESECDLTRRLTDDCLGVVFGKLGPMDRNSCALVCRRWFGAEAQSRQLLLLVARAQIVHHLPDLLLRFEHLTRLSLKCERKEASIDDGGLFLVGKYARQLERLKLKGCRQVTDLGLEEFSKVCAGLRKLSCGSCGFGARGLTALVAHSKSLEDLSVKRLKSLFDEADESVTPGQHRKLRRLCLKDLSNAHVFEALLRGSGNLQTLILARVSGDWDKLLTGVTAYLPRLTELRMEKVVVRDRGLEAVSRCKSLQVLYVVKCPECSNSGLSAVAQGCRSLRKLHLDGCLMGRMGDEGIRAVGEKCGDLQELVLIRINLSADSLQVLGVHCRSLERLAVCSSEAFGDSELLCIVYRCQALRKLCIKSCPISDFGLEALAGGGCPNLVKLKIKKCRRVSAPGASQLKQCRESLVVVVDLPPAAAAAAAPLQELEWETLQRRQPYPRLAKARLSFLAGPSHFVACTIRRITPS